MTSLVCVQTTHAELSSGVVANLELGEGSEALFRLPSLLFHSPTFPLLSPSLALPSRASTLPFFRSRSV